MKAVWSTIRAKFIPMYLLPAALGIAIASAHGFFDPFYAAMTLLGVFFAGVATNSFNVCWDAVTGIDAAAKPTPFSAAGDIGGNPIVRGIATPREVWNLALACWLLGGLIGVYLAITRGLLLLFFLANALFVTYFYSQKLSH